MTRNVLLIVILVVESACFLTLEWSQGRSTGLGGAAFISSYVMNLVAQSGPLLVASFGMTIIVATAGIDLSVGAAAALVAGIMARCEPDATFWITALPLGLASGLLLGLGNGLLIAFCDIPPIIATLGSMMLLRGLCLVVMGDREWATFSNVPGFERLGEAAGVAMIVAILFGFGGYWLARSRWWQEVRMIGGNRIAARYAGIRVDRRLVEVYLLAGFTVFLAALLYGSRNGAVSASAMTGFELQVIVAVVLGGARTQGGRGSIAGTLLAVFAIAVLEEGLRGSSQWGARNLPFKIGHLRFLMLGALLLIGVWMNQRRARA